MLLSQWAGSPAELVDRRALWCRLPTTVEGSKEASSPHNFYIEILLRTGTLGLLALLALTVGLLVATWRRSIEDAGVFGSGVLPALLMMQLVWFVAWIPGIEQGIVTGIAISVAACQPQATPFAQLETSLKVRAGDQ